jgi:hypothetical protein
MRFSPAGSTVNDDDSFPWARLDRNLLQCWVMQGRCPPPDDQHAAPDAIYAEVPVPVPTVLERAFVKPQAWQSL